MDNSCQSFSKYLNEALIEDLATREAELQDLRNSLRFRVGGIVLEAFPPSLRSFKAIWKLVRMYQNRPGKKGRVERGKLPSHALQESVVIFGSSSFPDETEVDGWVCEDENLVAQRLDLGEKGTLVMRRPASMLARRLARVKLQGWRVIWWPEDGASDFDPALVEYIVGQADEVRKGEPA